KATVTAESADDPDVRPPRDRWPIWRHLLPLALLAGALLALMIGDLACNSPVSVSEDDIDPTQRLIVRFEFGPNTNQNATFGIVMLDEAKDEKRLTFKKTGATNSTVVTIDSKSAIFGPTSGRTPSGVWEKKSNPSAGHRAAVPMTWLFHHGGIAA